MLTKKTTDQMLKDVYTLLAGIDNPQEMEYLLKDLCTNKELEQMAQRVMAARLLLEGKTYNQVIEATNISSATLSRVSRCVQYGKGYSSLLKEK